MLGDIRFREAMEMAKVAGFSSCEYNYPVSYYFKYFYCVILICVF